MLFQIGIAVLKRFWDIILPNAITTYSASSAHNLTANNHSVDARSNPIGYDEKSPWATYTAFLRISLSRRLESEFLIASSK